MSQEEEINTKAAPLPTPRETTLEVLRASLPELERRVIGTCVQSVLRGETHLAAVRHSAPRALEQPLAEVIRDEALLARLAARCREADADKVAAVQRLLETRKAIAELEREIAGSEP